MPKFSVFTVFHFDGVILGIVDGDTVDVSLDLGFSIHMAHRLRLARINAPEVNHKVVDETQLGYKAWRELERILPVGIQVRVETHKADIYGRYIAELVIPEAYPGSPVNISNWMLEHSFAVPYV